MLNISENSIEKSVRSYPCTVFNVLNKSRVRALPLVVLGSILGVVFISMFLPWTQNINAVGVVTTRSPEQRPQSVHTIISGRIEKWYVREGDHVEKGDTLIRLSEIKSEYFDASLVERTAEQLAAKEQSVVAYQEKVDALQKQYEALKSGLNIKINQAQNKVRQAETALQIDSMNLKVYEQKMLVAQNQYKRIKELYDKGLKSYTELQEKELKYQEAQGSYTNQQNKLVNQQNKYTYELDGLLGVEQEYNDKLAKSLADQHTALSAKMEASVEASKLRSQLANYSERREYYQITAPQSGYLNRTISRGIGEVIKEGDEVANIVPEKYDLAVEIYVKPMDLPLLAVDEKVRLRFDGWPAVVFSGWPEASTGVFDGRIDAIDRFIDQKGEYRLLVVPDDNMRPWPDKLSNGTGVYAFVLLNTVPVWYEIWRHLNGFPPNFYKSSESQISSKKSKK